MKLRNAVCICCCAATLMGSLFAGVPAAQAQTLTLSRTITISSPNTPTGSINPAAFLDVSVAPFDKGGPFTVTGYYRFKELGGHDRGTGDTPKATVFGVKASDTAGQWKRFSATFSTASSFSAKGLILWYMAGELSVADLVIKNAAGDVVYDLNADNALSAGEVTVSGTRGLWYIWNYGSYPDFLGAITVSDNTTGLVDGSSYTLKDKQLQGVPFGTDVLTVRSNFKKSEDLTAWKGSKQLSDTDLVTKDTTFVYNKGQKNSVTYTVAALTGDTNGDGKLDIRDLRAIKEASFGDLKLKNGVGDTDGDGSVGKTDVSALRSALLGELLYAKQSVGADALLQMAAPVGRLCKDSNRMYMELSASNFTLTGYFEGDVTSDIWVEKILDDKIGIYVEVDGAANMRYIELTASNAYQTVKLATGLAAGKHTIRVYKATDAKNDTLRISAVGYTGKLLKSATAKRRIEFLGDSITAGACIFDPSRHPAEYLVYGQTASWFGYAKKTADALNASYYCVANGGWRLCYSAGAYQSIRSIYPYTSMHSTVSKGAYDFSYDPDVVVINLGTNDWKQNQATYQKDTLELLQLVREKNPNATIVWAYGMMDQDHPSVGWIRSTVEQFAATDGNAYFIAMSENTNGMYAHPDKNAHAKAGETLAAFIKNIKGW